MKAWYCYLVLFFTFVYSFEFKTKTTRMISIIAKFTVAEGKNDEFIALAQDLVTKSGEEAGCIAYILNQRVNDEQVYLMIEQWQDQAAIDAHNVSEHFTTIVPHILDLAEVSVEVYQPV